MMKKNLVLTQLLLMAFLCLLPSCSKENELVGEWSYAFGLTNDYNSKRIYSESEYHPTFFHKLIFEKGNRESGTFIDAVYPMILPDTKPERLVGSKMKGTWKIEGKRLILLYSDDIELLNDDSLNSREKRELIDYFENCFMMNSWKEKGERGYMYEISDKKGTKYLRIPEIASDHSFSKKKDETK